MARILVVAGEASGDRLGGLLLSAFNKLSLHHTFVGVGGPALKEGGMELIVHFQGLDIVGGIEGILRLPRVYGVYLRLKRLITRREVDALLLIDYPGMNLRLAQIAHEYGVPVVYYVSPQVWAWRPGRIKKIRRAVDLMMVILPFEEAIYRDAGVPVVYVGHPLVEMVGPDKTREQFRKELGVSDGRELVALLPGSRWQELRYHLREMAQAAGILSRERGSFFVLPVAHTLPLEDVRRHWSGLPQAKGIKCYFMKGETYNALAASDAALVASGTATLEAALLGTPQVLIYRVHPITYMIAKRLAKVRWLSLVNILLGEEVVPELIQSDANATYMAERLSALLDNEGETMREAYGRLKEVLGPPGASARAAHHLATFLREKGL